MTQESIRIVILDDNGLFRSSLSRFLASEPGLEVAGECATCAEATELLNKIPVNVVLLDLDLGAERANQFIAVAFEGGYVGRFLLVAGSPDVRAAAMALKLGASGVFLKSEPPERLVRAIRLVAEGELWVDPEVIRRLAEQFVDYCPQLDSQSASELLEERERSVLLGILAGLTNRKIGTNMGLSESSVKNIVQRLFGKAGVKTRSQLVRVALEGSLGTTQNLMGRTNHIPMATLSQARQSPG